MVSLAWPYRKVRARLREAEALAGRPILGYGDLTAEAVARLTGLSPEAARRAKAREYDETLVLCPEEVEAVLEALEAVGLEWTHGGASTTPPRGRTRAGRRPGSGPCGPTPRRPASPWGLGTA